MPPADRWIWIAFVLLAYAALCAGIAWRERQRRLAAAREAAELAPGDSDRPPVIVTFASQTGQAEQLAWQTARRLHAAGVATRLLPMGELDGPLLAAGGRALFVVSTTGEGDAPDGALPFVEAVMEAVRPPSLAALQVAVLALGDRSYQQFCAFGRRVDDWLREHGAQPLAERIEVDGMDPAALAGWQRAVAGWAGATEADADAEDALPDTPFEPWHLLARERLNPGSAGAPLMRLDFVPAGGTPLPDWAAGDLVELALPDAGPEQRPRSYSVASVPAAGQLQLIVRLTQREDGSPGLASGLLCERLSPGATAAFRLRPNRSFHAGDNAGRPWLLVGNGSGLAGLRAHLQARAGRGLPGCWLVYGERQAAFDTVCANEIDAWQADGTLARVDRVFSRDDGPQRYVQDLLRDEAEALRRWVADGAAVYVCGSLLGMAAGVEAALTAALGGNTVAALRREGRYRRDVY